MFICYNIKEKNQNDCFYFSLYSAMMPTKCELKAILSRECEKTFSSSIYKSGSIGNSQDYYLDENPFFDNLLPKGVNTWKGWD